MVNNTLKANSHRVDGKLEGVGGQDEVLAGHDGGGRGVDLDVVEFKLDLRIRLLIGYAGLQAEHLVRRALGVPFNSVRDPLALLRRCKNLRRDCTSWGGRGSAKVAYKHVETSYARHVIVRRRHPERCLFLAIWT